MQPIRRIAQRTDHSEHHWHVFGSAACHNSRNRDFLGGEPAPAYRLDADDVARCHARGLEKRSDERVCRRNDRQPVGPAVVLIELVGGESVGDVVRGGGEVHG